MRKEGSSVATPLPSSSCSQLLTQTQISRSGGREKGMPFQELTIIFQKEKWRRRRYPKLIQERKVDLQAWGRLQENLPSLNLDQQPTSTHESYRKTMLSPLTQQRILISELQHKSRDSECSDIFSVLRVATEVSRYSQKLIPRQIIPYQQTECFIFPSKNCNDRCFIN